MLGRGMLPCKILGLRKDCAMRRFLDWLTGKTALRAELATWRNKATAFERHNAILLAEYRNIEKRIADNSAQVGDWALEKMRLNRTVETLERKIEEMKKQIREERKQ
jgi:chromosome segregation ATPase